MPKGDYSKTKESIVPLRGVVRNGRLAGLLDHEGKEISATRPSIGQSFLSALTGPVGRDATLVILGDSTGNEVNEWVYLFAQRLAAALPGVRVEYHLYDPDVTYAYLPPVVLQAGIGEDYVTVGADKRGWGVPGSAVPLVGADLRVGVDCALDVWSGVEQTLVAQYGAAGSRAWRLFSTVSGALALEWKTDGTNGPAAATVTSPGFVAGSRRKVRATLRVDNGAGGHEVKFFSSVDGGVTWSQHGSTYTGVGVTSIYRSTSQVIEMGSRGGVTGPATTSGAVGTFYGLDISDAVDGANLAPINVREYIETWGMAGVRSQGSTLRIFNGSVSGSKMADNLARIDRMCPRIQSAAAVIISSSHNEGAVYDAKGYIDSLDALVTAVNARIKSTRFALNTQNHKKAPQEPQRIDAHARRAMLIREVAAQRGYDLIDVYARMAGDPAMVKDIDGIHPSLNGSVTWSDEAYRVCGI